MSEVRVIRVDYSDNVSDQAPECSLQPPDEDWDQYYRIVTEEDPKSQRWLKQLGACLKNETSLKDDDAEYVLSAFPRGYILLEHNRFESVGKKLYLYGHPTGKGFRSVNEFLPHLLWLAKDTEHIVANCECKLCPAATAGADTNHTRPPKRKHGYTGMSALSKAEMEKAHTVMSRDLEAFAPLYRVGEVVLNKGAPCIVADFVPAEEPVDLRDALSRHRYTLVPLEQPDERLEQIPHAAISPFLSRVYAANDELSRIVNSASPVAKYNIQLTAAVPSGLPGPCYVAWYLGPEKIYHNDLVRVRSSNISDATKIMLLSHIVLDVATKVVKVRGDVFELTSSSDSSSKDDIREIPKNVLDIAKTLHKTARFVNAPGLELDISMADVIGRYYHPMAYTGTLIANNVFEIAKGRKSVIPAQVVETVNHVFEEKDLEESWLTLG